jgi:hypothetical protein
MPRGRARVLSKMDGDDFDRSGGGDDELDKLMRDPLFAEQSRFSAANGIKNAEPSSGARPSLTLEATHLSV